jgi:hypothetical protein
VIWVVYVVLGLVWTGAVAALVWCSASRLNPYAEVVDDESDLGAAVARHPAGRARRPLPAPGSGRGQAPHPRPFVPRQSRGEHRR